MTKQCQCFFKKIAYSAELKQAVVALTGGRARTQ